MEEMMELQEGIFDMDSQAISLGNKEIAYGIRRAKDASTFALPRRSNLFVGSAVLDDRGRWYGAGTVETLWQKSHHAEENAIMCGIADGAKKFELVFVSAPRKLFTPCGSCCDLIMEFGTDDCFVLHDNPETNVLTVFKKSSLMPFYPTRS
jgi:cytidine deaminase